jgi:hypothetical protein
MTYNFLNLHVEQLLVTDDQRKVLDNLERQIRHHPQLSIIKKDLLQTLVVYLRERLGLQVPQAKSKFKQFFKVIKNVCLDISSARYTFINQAFYYSTKLSDFDYVDYLLRELTITTTVDSNLYKKLSTKLSLYSLFRFWWIFVIGILVLVFVAGIVFSLLSTLITLITSSLIIYPIIVVKPEMFKNLRKQLEKLIS